MKFSIGKLTIEFNISIEKSYMREVKNALRNGRKLLAIKIYKDATGASLKESKDVIDSLCLEYYNPPKARLD